MGGNGDEEVVTWTRRRIHSGNLGGFSAMDSVEGYFTVTPAFAQSSIRASSLGACKG